MTGELHVVVGGVAPNLHAHSPFDGDWMNIRWTAHPGMGFTVCRKKVGDSGTVCSNNGFDISADGSNYFSGTKYAGFPTKSAAETTARIASFSGLRPVQVRLSTKTTGIIRQCTEPMRGA